MIFAVPLDKANEITPLFKLIETESDHNINKNDDDYMDLHTKNLINRLKS